jgi:hypothetical protein
MDDGRRRWTDWVMAAAAVATLAISLWILLPAIRQTMAHPGSPLPLFTLVVRVSLIGSLIAGLAVYAVAAAVEQRWLVRRAIGFIVALMIGVTLANISAAGWIHVFHSAGRTAAFSSRLSPKADSPFAQYRNQVREDRYAYQNELGELEYPRFLTPAALATPDGRENAHSKIVLARSLVAKYQSLYVVRIADLKDGYAKGVGGNAAAVERLDKTLAPEIAARQEWLKVADRIMAEQQAMIDDLTLSKGRLQAKGNAMLFGSTSDLETFNSHVAALNALQEKAHTLDLAIAHESDKTNEKMYGVEVGN